jgi:hypothetical protein
MAAYGRESLLTGRGLKIPLLMVWIGGGGGGGVGQYPIPHRPPSSFTARNSATP